MKQKTKNKPQVRQSQKKLDQNDQLTFLEHIYELRGRIFWILTSLIVVSGIAFQFKDALVAFIMAPLHGEKLVYLTPGGGFSFIFTLCLYFGALATIPVAVYHLYRFLQPIMGRASYRMVGILLSLSSILAIAGAAFGYIVAIPAAINFLTGFAGEAVSANLTAESYLGFVMAYMLGLAILFQLPLVVYMSDHIHRFPPGTLGSSQKFVILGAAVAAAIITPTPDIVNQMIIAGPIIVVYQLGVLAVYIRRRHDTKKPVPTEAYVQPAIVPVPVPEPVTEPDIEGVEEVPEMQPFKAAVPARAFAKPVVRRTVDGFIRTPSSPTLRSRPMTSPRPASTFVPPSARVRRSLDGFSVI